MTYDLVIIGGGPAGLSAANAAWEDGCRSICIVERDRELGGILNQCIQNGFGLHYASTISTPPVPVSYHHRHPGQGACGAGQVLSRIMRKNVCSLRLNEVSQQ